MLYSELMYVELMALSRNQKNCLTGAANQGNEPGPEGMSALHLSNEGSPRGQVFASETGLLGVKEDLHDVARAERAEEVVRRVLRRGPPRFTSTRGGRREFRFVSNSAELGIRLELSR